MKIKWLFIVWALLLGSTGVLFYLLLPSSEYTFYVTESIVIVCLLFLVFSGLLHLTGFQTALTRTINNTTTTHYFRTF